MKIKHVIVTITFFAIFCGLWSCQWHQIEPLEIEVPEDVSFATDLEPIFVDKCAGCHSSGSLDLTTGNVYSTLIDGGYVSTSNPESSLIYTKMNDDQHPSESGTFSAAELVTLLAWIEQGALEN